jgi:hypothetical protein
MPVKAEQGQLEAVAVGIDVDLYVRAGVDEPHPAARG